MIYYTCSHCDAEIETEDIHALEQQFCPICHKTNTVPQSEEQLREERRKQKTALKEWRRQKKAEELCRKREEELRAKESAEEASRIKREAEARRQREYAEALALTKGDAHVTRQWYCMSKGTWGPMPEARLQTWISSGRIGIGDLVRPDNIDVWLKVSDLPDVFVVPEETAGDNVKPNAPKCPRCGSAHLSNNKKGMDAGNACCGALLFGPLGLLCGLTDKVVVTCLKCGKQWKVGR
jgi:tellurium resistance protein TerD